MALRLFSLLLFIAEAHGAHGEFDRSAEQLARAERCCRRAAWLRAAAKLDSARGNRAGALEYWRRVLEAEPGDAAERMRAGPERPEDVHESRWVVGGRIGCVEGTWPGVVQLQRPLREQPQIAGEPFSGKDHERQQNSNQRSGPEDRPERGGQSAPGRSLRRYRIDIHTGHWTFSVIG